MKDEDEDGKENAENHTFYFLILKAESCIFESDLNFDKNAALM